MVQVTLDGIDNGNICFGAEINTITDMTGNLQYKLQKINNGTWTNVIGPDTNSKFVIFYPGTYKVIVTNDNSGSAESAETVIAIKKSTVTNAGYNFLNQQNTSFNLSATTTLNTYKWYKNGVLLENTTQTLTTSDIGCYVVSDGCDVTTNPAIILGEANLPYTNNFTNTNNLAIFTENINDNFNIVNGNFPEILVETNNNKLIFNTFYRQRFAVDEVILPKINLQNNSSLNVNFDLAYSGDNSYYENLILEYSTDNGNTFAEIYNKIGSELATFSGPGNLEPSDNNWRSEQLTINGLNSAPSIIIKFKVISDYGNNVYIRNLNITNLPKWSLMGSFNSWTNDINLTQASFNNKVWYLQNTNLNGKFKFRYNQSWQKNIGGQKINSSVNTTWNEYSTVENGPDYDIADDNYTIIYFAGNRVDSVDNDDKLFIALGNIPVTESLVNNLLGIILDVPENNELSIKVNNLSTDFEQVIEYGNKVSFILEAQYDGQAPQETVVFRWKGPDDISFYLINVVGIDIQNQLTLNNPKNGIYEFGIASVTKTLKVNLKFKYNFYGPAKTLNYEPL